MAVRATANGFISGSEWFYSKEQLEKASRQWTAEEKVLFYSKAEQIFRTVVSDVPRQRKAFITIFPLNLQMAAGSLAPSKGTCISCPLDEQSTVMGRVMTYVLFERLVKEGLPLEVGFRERGGLLPLTIYFLHMHRYHVTVLLEADVRQETFFSSIALYIQKGVDVIGFYAQPSEIEFPVLAATWIRKGGPQLEIIHGVAYRRMRAGNINYIPSIRGGWEVHMESSALLKAGNYRGIGIYEAFLSRYTEREKSDEWPLLMKLGEAAWAYLSSCERTREAVEVGIALANLCLYQSDVELASAYARASLGKTSLLSKDDPLKITAYLLRSFTYTKMGRKARILSEKKDYFNKAQELLDVAYDRMQSADVKDAQLWAEFYFCEAEIYLKNPFCLVQMAQRAYFKARSFESVDELCNRSIQIGLIYINLSKKKFSSVLEELKELYACQLPPWQLLQVRLIEAECWFRQENFEKSIAVLQIADAFARQQGIYGELERIQVMIAAASSRVDLD